MQIAQIAALIDLVNAHPLATAYIGSAFVQAMRDPDAPKEPLRKAAHRYLYSVSHLLVNAIPNKYKPPVSDPNVKA